MKTKKQINYGLIMAMLWCVIVLQFVAACVYEQIKPDTECNCTKTYWQYVKPRVYQQINSTAIGCENPLSIEDAVALALPGNDVFTIECIIN